MSDTIIMYKSDYCSHSSSVERFFRKNDVAVDYVSIDGNPDARQKLIELNKGFASVPTLLFPDGTQMTEPTIGELRKKLGIEAPSLTDRVKGALGR